MSIEEHAALMKSTAQARTAMNKAIDSSAYTDARVQIAILRKNFMAMRTFWSVGDHLILRVPDRQQLDRATSTSVDRPGCSC
jgi:hypothetical protein